MPKGKFGIRCRFCASPEDWCVTCRKDDNIGYTMFTPINELKETDKFMDDNKKEESRPVRPLSKYEQVASEIGALVAEKNQAYGNSFAKCGEFLKLLYPDGINPTQYQDMLALVRIFDKQMRIANKKDAFGESPYKDIVGYGLLGLVVDECVRLS